MPASVTSLSSSPSSFCPQLPPTSVSATAAAVLNNEASFAVRNRRPGGDFNPPSVHPVALEMVLNGALSPTQPPPLPLKMSALAGHKRHGNAASPFRACLDSADCAAASKHAKHDAAAIIKCLNGGAIGKARDDDAVVPLLPKEDEAPAEIIALQQKKASAPQPPVQVLDKQPANVDSRDVILKQPNANAAHVPSEQTDDLIRFSADNPQLSASPAAVGKSQSAQKAINEQPDGHESDFDDEDSEDGPAGPPEEEEDRPGSPDSVKTADEQMDYLEGLESCPCYAKCCIDSIVTLFCVTLLG